MLEMPIEFRRLNMSKGLTLILFEYFSFSLTPAVLECSGGIILDDI